MIAGYIYLITNTVNGKKYVGQTKVSVSRRWIQHVSAAKKGSTFALHNAMRKYGPDKFVITCLEEVKGTRFDLVEAEVRLILANNAVAPKGYNLTQGGEGCDYTVPGVRERHAAAMRAISRDPEWRKKFEAGLRKRSADPEWKKAHALGLRNCSELRAARLRDRDAKLSPEVLACRLQWRAKTAERRARLKSRQAGVG